MLGVIKWRLFSYGLTWSQWNQGFFVPSSFSIFDEILNLWWKFKFWPNFQFCVKFLIFGQIFNKRCPHTCMNHPWKSLDFYFFNFKVLSSFIQIYSKMIKDVQVIIKQCSKTIQVDGKNLVSSQKWTGFCL